MPRTISVKTVRPGDHASKLVRAIESQGGYVDKKTGSSHMKAKTPDGHTCASIPNHELRDGILKAIVAGLVAHGFYVWVLIPSGIVEAANNWLTAVH